MRPSWGGGRERGTPHERRPSPPPRSAAPLWARAGAPAAEGSAEHDAADLDGDTEITASGGPVRRGWNGKGAAGSQRESRRASRRAVSASSAVFFPPARPDRSDSGWSLRSSEGDREVRDARAAQLLRDLHAVFCQSKVSPPSVTSRMRTAPAPDCACREGVPGRLERAGDGGVAQKGVRSRRRGPRRPPSWRPRRVRRGASPDGRPPSGGRPLEDGLQGAQPPSPGSRGKIIEPERHPAAASLAPRSRWRRWPAPLRRIERGRGCRGDGSVRSGHHARGPVEHDEHCGRRAAGDRRRPGAGEGGCSGSTRRVLEGPEAIRPDCPEPAHARAEAHGRRGPAGARGRVVTGGSYLCAVGAAARRPRAGRAPRSPRGPATETQSR
jgi:hypothetical protein